MVEPNGDEAFERLWREEGKRLWWAVLGFAGNREIASDAVAEAFARAWRDWDRIDEPVPWVWKVAFRLAAADLRESRRRVADRGDEDSYELESPSESILPMLAKLSAGQRAAIMLHYYGGYSTKEAGRMLGMSGATVAVHLHRGRARLRRMLEAEDA